MMLHRNYSRGGAKNDLIPDTPKNKHRCSINKKCCDFQLSPSSMAAPASLTSSAPSTPSKSPTSPPRVHRFSTNSPLEALRFFGGRNPVLPMLPFGRQSSPPTSVPMVDHQNNIRHDCDQRERLKHLMKQWKECQRKLNDVTKHETTPDVVSSKLRAQTFSSEPGHDTIEYEMKIHSSSVEGTAEAAAWHLHGQSGGRVTPVLTNKSRFGSNVSVMNSKAMSEMRKVGSTDQVQINHKADRFIESDQCSNVTNVAAGDIELGQCNNYTNVVVDVGKNADTRITSKSSVDASREMSGFANDRDVWSTGVASAVVMGTAARYNKAFFMFPHGRRVLLPLIMAIMALTLSIFVSTSCRFMSILPSSSLGQGFQVGPWFYLSSNPQSEEVCMPYPSDIEMDFWFIVARATSALAVCLGVGLLLWTCTLTCIPSSRSAMNGLGLCFFVASILQLTTSFFYLSNNCKSYVDELGDVTGGGYFGGTQCTANQDLVFCMAASALYFATGWLLYIAQGVIANDPGASSTEVYTWSAATNSADFKKGMRTIEKSWVRIPDGSTLMATVVVERKRETNGSIKTTHQIKTEILPAS